MRTTVNLDDDVLQAVEALRAERGLRLSEAVNELVRRAVALADQPDPAPFRQEVSSMGAALVPMDDIAAALEHLEGPAQR
ncbi:CopG family transcriptional regulator [Euzebya tangerina]|uniref:CopG family transcriptional regulator n=1 Tax=Euzebya tangerina TaxID=591198 RepID=UPI0013C35E22|nr:CopG family transcriptional regulator [Euzebya tangerina]